MTEQRRSRTQQGFIKAKYLSDDDVEAIIAAISTGMNEAVACRMYDTSHTQFSRRVKTSSHFNSLLEAAREMKRMMRADRLDSPLDFDGYGEHSFTRNRPRLHEGSLPD